jgi:hypothetical protein
MRSYLPLILILTILTTACVSTGNNLLVEHVEPEWVYSDLRHIDPIDSPDPKNDAIAVYFRKTGDDQQIRIDLLESISQIPTHDIYILFDDRPGGNNFIKMDNNINLTTVINWDTLLNLSASGDMKLINSAGEYVLHHRTRVLRDPIMDTIVISIRNLILNSLNTSIQIILTESNTDHVLDNIGPLKTSSAPPEPIPIMIAFWDIFLPYTPAQVLRSWDGAHTGPSSSRHGLKHLLNGIENSKIPVYLFDLNTIDNLSTLDYIGYIDTLHKLQSKNLIFLPETIPIVNNSRQLDVEEYLHFYSDEKENFDISESPSLYLPQHLLSTPLLSRLVISNNEVSEKSIGCVEMFKNFGGIFVLANDYAQCSSADILDLLGSVPQATPDGLSIQIKSMLIQELTKTNKQQILIGGSLRNSEWGEPKSALNSLNYINAHPWIRVITNYDILSSNIHGGSLTNMITTENIGNNHKLDIYDGLLDELKNSPTNRITDVAWHTFYSMINQSPIKPSSLTEKYLGQIGHLIFAAGWAEKPTKITTCDIDIDWDRETECVLADNHIFISIEKAGGYISFGFINLPDGIHQFIAPTYQFAIGLSDPSSWDLSNNLLSDPNQILGAFIEQNPDLEAYTDTLKDSGIVLTNQDNSISKEFALSETGIQVSIYSEKMVSVMIPIGLDPWTRYTQGWGDMYNKHPGTLSEWNWGIDSGPLVSIQSTAPLSTYTFIDSRDMISFPENPNFDYSPGHYLPFPMALVEINDIYDLFTEINITPNQ